MDDPEYVIRQTYKLLQSMNAKIDAMMRHDNITLNNIAGMGNAVEGISTKIDTIAKNSSTPGYGEGQQGGKRRTRRRRS